MASWHAGTPVPLPWGFCDTLVNLLAISEVVSEPQAFMEAGCRDWHCSKAHEAPHNAKSQRLCWGLSSLPS